MNFDSKNGGIILLFTAKYQTHVMKGKVQHLPLNCSRVKVYKSIYGNTPKTNKYVKSLVLNCSTVTSASV